jgi:uncharacterized protein (TIGR02265 family)
LDALARALEEVKDHCDVVDRLSTLPPSAKIRGLYARSVEAVLARAGLEEPYRVLFPERFSAIRWYALAEFIPRLVVGASLLMGPVRVHEGLFEIGRRNAAAVGESLLGRALLRVLARDPKLLLQQGIAARRQTHSFGHWELTFPGPGRAVVEMVDEYLYIESYMLGAARGTFDAIGVPVKAEAVLETPYKGRHLLSW